LCNILYFFCISFLIVIIILYFLYSTRKNLLLSSKFALSLSNFLRNFLFENGSFSIISSYVFKFSSDTLRGIFVFVTKVFSKWLILSFNAICFFSIVFDIRLFSIKFSKLQFSIDNNLKIKL